RQVTVRARKEISASAEGMDMAIYISSSEAFNRSAVKDGTSPSSRSLGLTEGGKRGNAQGRNRKARKLSHVSTQLCDTSARSRIRHPHGPGTARPCGFEHDDGLSARSQSRRAWRSQPARSAVAYLTPRLRRFGVRSASSLWPPPTNTSSACGA